MNGDDRVLFQTTKAKLWKARALPASILVLGLLIAAWAFYLFATGLTDLLGLLMFLALCIGTSGIGYFGTFGRNRLMITVDRVAPPGKPLFRPGIRELAIPWKEIVAVEVTQDLISGPRGVSYAFGLRTSDGRRFPFEALHVAWLTESTREMRRVYEMMNEISDALKRQRLETLDADKRLMTRLREIQKADYPEFDLFSRTIASKLAMIVGGPLLLAGVLIVLLKVPTHPLLAASLWIVGGLVFGLGLSTKRALPGWGKKGRSAGL